MRVRTTMTHSSARQGAGLYYADAAIRAVQPAGTNPLHPEPYECTSGRAACGSATTTSGQQIRA